MRKQHDFHDLDNRLESLDVESSWNQEHHQQLKTRILRDVEKNKPGTTPLGRFPYKYYFSLGAAVLILWILVSPSFQTLFPASNIVTSGDGPEATGGMLRVIFILLAGSLFIVGTVFFFRNNERANKLFWDTNGFGLLSDIMRELVSKFFNLLVFILGVYLLVNNIVLFLSLIIVFWIKRRYEKQVKRFNYAYPIQIIGSLLIILYFAFKMYTPYFFTEEYLIQSGLEKIEIYYEATGDNDLTLEERIELAKIPYGSRAEFLFSRRLYVEEQGENIIHRDYTLIELVDFSRRFHEYSLVVEVEVQWYEEELQFIERELRRYTFEREEGDFRIIGGGILSGYQKSLLDLD